MATALIATIMSVLELLEEWLGFKVGLTQVGVEELLQVLTIIFVWFSTTPQFKRMFNTNAG